MLMKGVFYNEYGSADVLRYTELADPRRGADQVLIRVAACSVNPIDWRLRRGDARFLFPFGFPRIPGFDLAGTIEAAPAHSGFQPGERVAAFLDHLTGGAYAELAVCSPQVVAKLPESVSFEDGAALGLAGTTAVQSLRDYGRLGTGQHVVITGASGGVGSLAVQIAKSRGARVTAVASGTNHDLVMSLGADRFVDYHQDRWLRSVDDCDLFFDAAGKCDFSDVKLILKADGRFISTEPNLKNVGLSLLTAVVPGRTCRTMLARANARDLRELISLCELGQLKVVHNTTFPLPEAAEAHRHGEQGKGVGKIVLTVSQGSFRS
jgi:NADPH:quinone reductase-like Zn-dependent oxidoreductase